MTASDDGLLACERRAWQDLVAAARAWAGKPTKKAAERLGRYGRRSYKIVIPQPRDRERMLTFSRFGRLARSWPELNSDERERDEAELASLAAAVAAIVGEPTPEPILVAPAEPRQPWYMED